MITIFRRLRQKLIDSGNITRYLLYAVGEILLVVIGILIALQVNNWNEERKLLSEEERILQALKSEISQSIDQLENRYNTESGVAELIKIIIINDQRFDSLLNHPKIDSLMWRPLWMTVNETPVLQTYSDLKSSGNISIIQNHQIREGLSDLQFGLNNLDRQERDLLTVQQLRIDAIPIEKLDYITMLQATKYDEFNGSENDYKTLFKDRTVRNIMGVKLSMIERALEIRLSMIESCNNLLYLIENELEPK